MDTSSDYTDHAKTPESHAERIAHVSELIASQSDDTNTSQGGDNTGGDDVPQQDVREPGSGSSSMDVSKSNATDGVEDAAQDDQKDVATEAEPPVNLSALAEHLGVEPADVYELEVPMAEGQAVTLGQLKDEYKQYGPAKEYQEKLVQERDGFEKQVLQTRAELSAIMSVIPDNMKEAIINAGRQHQQAWAKNQEQAVLEAIPDWQDADQRAKDRANLIEDGAEYGFSEQEITYTQDARTLRMLRDFSRMKRELQGMRAAAKSEPGKANPPGKSSPISTNRKRLQQALAKAKADPTMQGKAAVVSQLIRNQ